MEYTLIYRASIESRTMGSRFEALAQGIYGCAEPLAPFNCVPEIFTQTPSVARFGAQP